MKSLSELRASREKLSKRLEDMVETSPLYGALQQSVENLDKAIDKKEKEEKPDKPKEVKKEAAAVVDKVAEKEKKKEDETVHWGKKASKAELEEMDDFHFCGGWKRETLAEDQEVIIFPYTDAVLAKKGMELLYNPDGYVYAVQGKNNKTKQCKPGKLSDAYVTKQTHEKTKEKVAEADEKLKKAKAELSEVKKAKKAGSTTEAIPVRVTSQEGTAMEGTAGDGLEFKGKVFKNPQEELDGGKVAELELVTKEGEVVAAEKDGEVTVEAATPKVAKQVEKVKDHLEKKREEEPTTKKKEADKPKPKEKAKEQPKAKAKSSPKKKKKRVVKKMSKAKEDEIMSDAAMDCAVPYTGKMPPPLSRWLTSHTTAFNAIKKVDNEVVDYYRLRGLWQHKKTGQVVAKRQTYLSHEDRLTGRLQNVDHQYVSICLKEGTEKTLPKNFRITRAWKKLLNRDGLKKLYSPDMNVSACNTLARDAYEAAKAGEEGAGDLFKQHISDCRHEKHKAINTAYAKHLSTAIVSEIPENWKDEYETYGSAYKAAATRLKNRAA